MGERPDRGGHADEPLAQGAESPSTPDPNGMAQECARLGARLADITAERDTYRQIAHAVLDQLHALARERDLTSERLQQLLDRLRG